MNYLQAVSDYIAISYHHVMVLRLAPQIDTHEAQARTRYTALTGVQKNLCAIRALCEAISEQPQANGFDAKDPQMVELLKNASVAGANLDPKKVLYSKVEASELMTRLESVMADLETNQQHLTLDIQESLFQRSELLQQRMQHVKAIDSIYTARLS